MPFVASRPLVRMLDPSAVPKAGRAMTRKAGKNLQDDTRKYTPVYEPHPDDPPRARRPGTARESVKVEPVRAYVGGGAKGWRVRAYTEDPIFPHIEWSTRPHLIRPIKNRPNAALRFGIGSPRRVVFAKVVHHPGTRGQHPFARGAATLSVKVPRIFAPELHQFGKDLVGGRGGSTTDNRAGGAAVRRVA